VAETGMKAMIPIDRPFLDYLLHVVAEAGYRRACLVIGPEHGAVREYYGKLATRRLAVSFAVQEKPRGTADAVAAAEGFAGGDDFLMLNSDNYYPVEACRGLRELDGAGVALFERDALVAGSNIPGERISKFAAAVISPGRRLVKVIEKPDDAALAALGDEVYVSMNCWRFTPRIFEACRRIAPSPRGELEITDAVQYAIERLGEKFAVVKVKAAVLDLSSRGDIAAVAERLAGSRVEL